MTNPATYSPAERIKEHILSSLLRQLLSSRRDMEGELATDIESKLKAVLLVTQNLLEELHNDPNNNYFTHFKYKHSVQSPNSLKEIAKKTGVKLDEINPDSPSRLSAAQRIKENMKNTKDPGLIIQAASTTKITRKRINMPFIEHLDKDIPALMECIGILYKDFPEDVQLLITKFLDIFHTIIHHVLNEHYSSSFKSLLKSKEQLKEQLIDETGGPLNRFANQKRFDEILRDVVDRINGNVITLFERLNKATSLIVHHLIIRAHLGGDSIQNLAQQDQPIDEKGDPLSGVLDELKKTLQASLPDNYESLAHKFYLELSELIEDYNQLSTLGNKRIPFNPKNFDQIDWHKKSWQIRLFLLQDFAPSIEEKGIRTRAMHTQEATSRVPMSLRIMSYINLITACLEITNRNGYTSLPETLRNRADYAKNLSKAYEQLKAVMYAESKLYIEPLKAQLIQIAQSHIAEMLEKEHATIAQTQAQEAFHLSQIMKCMPKKIIDKIIIDPMLVYWFISNQESFIASIKQSFLKTIHAQVEKMLCFNDLSRTLGGEKSKEWEWIHDNLEKTLTSVIQDALNETLKNPESDLFIFLSTTYPEDTEYSGDTDSTRTPPDRGYNHTQHLTHDKGYIIGIPSGKSPSLEPEPWLFVKSPAQRIIDNRTTETTTPPLGRRSPWINEATASGPFNTPDTPHVLSHETHKAPSPPRDEVNKGRRRLTQGAQPITYGSIASSAGSIAPSARSIAPSA